MNDTAHIFNPKDKSLEARIEAFRGVYEAWQNAESSMGMLDDDKWREALGSHEEVQQAIEISSRSLHLASHSFSQEEIAFARKNNLLQADEIQKIIATQRLGEMRSVREGSQSSDSFERGQKR